MFSLAKQVFFVLMIFSESSATKCLSLNDESCMVRSTLIDMNPLQFKYYWFMISLDKCSGSCKFLSSKICVPKKTKDINLKAFNMIKSKNEAKTMTKHISCDCKFKFNSTTYNWNKLWNNVTCQCDCKNYRTCKKKIIVGILAHVFVRMISI